VNRLYVAATLALLAAVALALPDYTGYSGAPGSSGNCASTCHGSSGGTIQVAGFPLAYELSQTYVVSVFKQSGSSINNFNASIRVGTTSQTAGVILAGDFTATYSTGGEPNGVHLSSQNQDSCTFIWTAPDSGVGDVRLYLAGHQGNMSGANTELVLVASQATGIAEAGARPEARLGLILAPAVAHDLVSVRVNAPAGSGTHLRVIAPDGRLVATLAVPDPGRAVSWRPQDATGNRLSQGTYLVVLQRGTERLVRKLVIE
jgi:hypothetical protein